MKLWGWLVVFGCTLISGTAWACPACALRDNEPGRALLFFGMVTLPFVVVGGSWLAIRRLGTSDKEEPDSHDAQHE